MNNEVLEYQIIDSKGVIESNIDIDRLLPIWNDMLSGDYDGELNSGLKLVAVLKFSD